MQFLLKINAYFSRFNCNKILLQLWIFRQVRVWDRKSAGRGRTQNFNPRWTLLQSRRFLGGVGFFCPTPDVHLDQFLHHTPKMGIPVEMVVSFETFVETDCLLCTTISIYFKPNSIPFMSGLHNSESS